MSDQIRCSRCGETKSSEQFAPSHVRTLRSGERAGMCRPCNTEYQKSIRHRSDSAGRAKVDSVEITCSICGQAKPAVDFRWNSRTGYRGECKECERTQLRCSQCGEVKPHDAFPPSGSMATGRHSLCNACHNDRNLAKYHGDPEHRAKHKEQSRSERAKAWRKQYWRKTKDSEPRKSARRDYMRWLYNTDPIYRIKAKARSLVAHALKSGKLTRPDRCEQCGRVGEVEGHHYAGYWPRSTWLMLRWLCLPCHVAADMQQPADKLFVGFGLPELAQIQAKIEGAADTLGIDQHGILKATTECLGEDECHVFLNVIDWLKRNGYAVTRAD